MHNQKELIDLFNKEQEFLKEQEQKNLQLFEKLPQVESSETLTKAGITFPFPDLPLGYLKYHPLDFIVEEIQTDKSVSSVDLEEADLQIL